MAQREIAAKVGNEFAAEKFSWLEFVELVISSGQIISSGYGGSGNFKLWHSYAANVTAAMWGPRYKRNVWRPVKKSLVNKLF